MFKGKIVESKIYKWNLEDAVKCGIVNLKTGKYKHQQSGELLTVKEAITRGLIDGESTIIENPLNNILMTLKEALDTLRINDEGHVIDAQTEKLIVSLESMFNTRKLFSAFNENTGEIFLSSKSKIVPFERAIRKNKLDKSVRIFDPKSNKDLTINDAIERAIIDKTSGMIIDPKGGNLLSVKEAVKRGILSITGAPVVTGHHGSETIETPTITSRNQRHSTQQFDHVNEVADQNISYPTKSSRQQKRTKTPIARDTEFFGSDILKRNPNLMSDPNVITNLKTTNEEHRKKIKGNSVIESLKGDFKETVLKPGETPKVTSSSSYGSQLKSNLYEH
jgi:hypothetical protein